LAGSLRPRHRARVHRNLADPPALGPLYSWPIDDLRVLFVCTANINRSPMAAGLLARLLIDAGRRPLLASAGLMEPGHPASPHAVATLAERGVDLSAHRTRRLSADLVAAADLVLGMESRHIRAVAVLVRDALDRSFTLKEFLRLAVTVGQRRAGEPLPDYLGRLAEDRDLDRLQRDDPADAVSDPVGRPRADFERCADELDLLVRGVRYFVWDGTSPRPAPNRAAEEQRR